MKGLKPILSRRQIAEALITNYKKDLTKLEQAGIRRDVMVTYAVFIVTRLQPALHGEYGVPWIRPLSNESIKSFRRRAIEARKLANGVESLSRKAKAWGFVDAYGHLKSEEESLRKVISNLGKICRKNGRKDHDQWIPIVVGWIRTDNKQFNSWEPLHRVLAGAYGLAGREADAKYITVKKLIRTAASLSKDVLSMPRPLRAVKGEQPTCQQR